MTCDAYTSHVGFTSTPKCTAERQGDDGPTWKEMTNIVAASWGCCGAQKKSACWEDVSAGVCKTASDFLPNKIVEMGDQSFSCDSLATMYRMTSSAQCSKPQGDNNKDNQQLSMATMTHMIAAFGCCGSSGKSACWEDVSESVCQSSASWLPGHQVMGGPSGMNINCDQMALGMGYSTSVDCSDAKKRSSSAKLGAGGCCGTTKKDACWVDLSANVCKNAADCTLLLFVGLDAFFLFDERDSCDHNFIYCQNHLTFLDSNCLFFFLYRSSIPHI